ncbi:arsenite-transporting ATPase [Rhodococcus opacus M213]|uniref:Arsenite-transporting ATPase n=1 Tax=Rhodococcus opacus M213 TaxID=1129896 RepID=K8X947_RHOOP|nr:arsenite-transporting ATPase [Rhodococcus opacus M213]
MASITEQLSGSCTTEIASFNEFAGMLTDYDTVADFDRLLFDTAPTGHTIRLPQTARIVDRLPQRRPTVTTPPPPG